MYRFFATFLTIGSFFPYRLRAAAPTDFKSLVDILLDVIGVLVSGVFVLAFLVLVWGIVKTWILKPGDATELENGRKLVVVSIVVLTLMIGIWGVLAILKTTFFDGV